MTVYVGLALAVAAAAFVAWPLLRGRRPEAPTEGTAPNGMARLEEELRMDAAAGRIPLGELDAVRNRVRDSLG